MNQIFWRSNLSWKFTRIAAFPDVSWFHLYPWLSSHISPCYDLSFLWIPFPFMVALKLLSLSYTFHFMLHSSIHSWFITLWLFGVIHHSMASSCFPCSESPLFSLNFLISMVYSPFHSQPFFMIPWNFILTIFSSLWLHHHNLHTYLMVTCSLIHSLIRPSICKLHH